MEQKVKEIVARYVKIPADQMQPGTVIDRSAMASSILLHRMYASLAAAGIVVENYLDIKTFGVLMQRLGNDNLPPLPANADAVVVFKNEPEAQASHPSVGIDIEEIGLLPPAPDYREHAFYTMNFAPSEIAYCILQPNPQASFAGLFAAKEAIVKADNNYLKSNFNAIIIDHLPNGKPIHPQFSLSISHTAAIAAAVAVPLPVGTVSPSPNLASAAPNLPVLYLVAFSALILSLASVLILWFSKN